MKRIAQLISFCARFAWHRARKNEEAMYTTVFEAVDTMGGVYVKLLQFLSLRVGLFPDSAKLRFLTFYDQVKVDPINVRTVLSGEIGNDKLTRFREIQEKPFASGTFGQVYKGTLIDGREIIIKVKRPRVKEALRVDFAIIRFLGYLFDLFYDPPIIHVQRLIREFQDITYRELNYKQEVENALYLYEQYINHPIVSIPYTHADLSTNDIIVQDYVGGISVTDLLRIRGTQTDVHRWLMDQYNTDLRFIMKRFSYDCLWQIFTLDKFFSDPHPGNLKILPNNKYACIDFGIMEPSPLNKRDYFRVIKYLSEGADNLDTKALGEELLSIGSHYLYKCFTTYDRIFSEPHTSLRNSVLDRYSELIEDWREEFRQIESGQAENYTKVWLDLFMMGEQFNMRLPKGLFAGLRASALITSFTRYLDPSYHFMKHIYQDLSRDIDEQKLLNLEDAKHRSIGIEQAVETVSDWFSGLAETDLMLYRDVTRFAT